MNFFKTLFLSIFLSANLLAATSESHSTLQQITVTGAIADDTGETLPGVNVTVKGTTIGVSSDANGRFSINIPNRDAVLVFSYVGYVTQELPVGNQTQVNVVMIDDSQQLEEVVVVGYGTQRKVNMTGSVSAVDVGKMIDNRSVTNLSAGLSGLVGGLVVTAGSGGRPGYDGATLRVRGQGTTNNSDPFVVIDGVQGNMNDINPQDVESISVLKDAASSAIYGSRAANGVILITTRKGRDGTARITYNGYLSSENLERKLNMVSNYAEYMELFNEGLKNTGQALQFSQAKIDEWRAAGNSDPVKYPNTDIFDVVFRSAWMQNHTLSVSGGMDKIHYYISGNYVQNPGIMENSAYNKFSLRSNMDVNVKKWFTLGMNAYGYRGVADLGLDDENRFPYLTGTTPGMCFRAPDGRYGGVNNPEDDVQSAVNNILRGLNSMKGDRTTNKIVSRIFGQLRPMDGLSIEGSYTYDFQDAQWYYQPVFLDLWNFYENVVQTSGTGRTSVSNSNEKTLRQQMDGLIRYEKNIGQLNIQAMAGASQEMYRYQWFTASKLDLTSPELTELNAATMDASASGNYTNWAMRSFFGRINLNWADKYLLEANLRADYSSRFAPGATRRGIFPSFSAGWRVSEEDFMQDISWVNMLKIRASYGGLGNNTMGGNRDRDGNYNYLSLYSARNYVLNNGVQVGFAQGALSNAAITWETTYVTNFGVDFALLSKLDGSLDFFIKDTKDILISLPAPLVHGNASIPRVNAGEVRNTGGELTLTWNDKIGNFRYFLGGNLGLVKNKLTKFRGDVKVIDGTNLLLEGQPINIQYVMKVDRLVQTDEDMAYVQSLVDKNPNYFRSYTRPQKGDLLYADTNGDGELDADDRIMVGNGPNPPVSYGINFGVSWKGIDFSCLLQGVSGVKLYWSGWDPGNFHPIVRRGNQLNKTITDGRWYEGRPDKATYPRLLNNTDSRNIVSSDFWLQNKSYLKVRNIQLGYTLPRSISQKILLESARIYGSIDNALTFTKYQGLDPEVDGTKYPTLRMTTIGINLTF